MKSVMANEPNSTGLLTEVAQHLGAIFRHMLPGILVLAGASVAYPDWFRGLNLDSWRHLVVLASISIAVGNTWFALNRYGLDQLVDYFLYLFKSDGPARGIDKFSYLNDLGQYTYRSLHSADSSFRARQHVAFRASTVLLAWTLGELLVVFAFCHASDSLFVGHKFWMVVGECWRLLLVCGEW
jgi:hypothetical protein